MQNKIPKTLADWQKLNTENEVIVNEEELTTLFTKFKSGSWQKELHQKYIYYNKKPFEEKRRKIFLETIKQEVFLINWKVIDLEGEQDYLIDTYLKKPEFLELVNKELDKKVVGENEARLTIFLVANMKLVENLNKASDNLMVNAHSGTGKDYITEAIFDLLPNSEKEELIRITPKVLAYKRNRLIEGQELSTWKKISLRLEDVGNNVLNDDAFKVMCSANPNKINNYETIIRNKLVRGEIEGKPSIILTIASANPKEEILRRFPILFLDEGRNQTKEILKRQSEFAKKGKTIEYNHELIKALELLSRVKVKVPFSDYLLNIFSDENVIVRTHYNRFLDCIKTSCAIFQYQRQKDGEGFYVAEQQDYEYGAMVLRNTTSNILMIPLTKLRKNILDIFQEDNLERKSVDDLEDNKEIGKLNITPEWLRKQLDWLVSKGFLTKDKERRYDEAGKIKPKPVFVYSFNPIHKLDIPSWEELTNISSNTSFYSNSYNSSFTPIIPNFKEIWLNLLVNELNEVIDLKTAKHTFDKKEQIYPKITTWRENEPL